MTVVVYVNTSKQVGDLPHQGLRHHGLRRPLGARIYGDGTSPKSRSGRAQRNGEGVGARCASRRSSALGAICKSRLCRAARPSPRAKGFE